MHNGRVYVMGSTQGDLGNPTQDYGRLGLYLAVLDQASGARIFNTVHTLHQMKSKQCEHFA